MANSEYADSAQARETDKAYQREHAPARESASQAFWAACEARAKAERLASRDRVRVAVDGIGVILGYRK